MLNDYKEILIVETHTLVAYGLLQAVHKIIPNSVVKIAISLDEAEKEVALHSFDILIFYINPVNKALFRLIANIRELNSDVLILLGVSMYYSIDVNEYLCDNQINALLRKEDISQEFEIAMHQLLLQESYCSEVFSSLSVKLISKSRTKTHKKDLPTKREIEVLERIVQGETTKQIAAILQIKVNTVETHRKNLIQKLYAKNAIDLVVKAISRGWIVIK